jgi:hypothetical protein
VGSLRGEGGKGDEGRLERSSGVYEALFETGSEYIYSRCKLDNWPGWDPFNKPDIYLEMMMKKRI